MPKRDKERLGVRCSHDEHVRWQRLARRLELTTSDLARFALAEVEGARVRDGDAAVRMRYAEYRKRELAVLEGAK